MHCPSAPQFSSDPRLRDPEGAQHLRDQERSSPVERPHSCVGHRQKEQEGVPGILLSCPHQVPREQSRVEGAESGRRKGEGYRMQSHPPPSCRRDRKGEKSPKFHCGPQGGGKGGDSPETVSWVPPPNTLHSDTASNTNLLSPPPPGPRPTCSCQGAQRPASLSRVVIRQMGG